MLHSWFFYVALFVIYWVIGHGAMNLNVLPLDLEITFHRKFSQPFFGVWFRYMIFDADFKNGGNNWNEYHGLCFTVHILWIKLSFMLMPFRYNCSKTKQSDTPEPDFVANVRAQNRKDYNAELGAIVDENDIEKLRTKTMHLFLKQIGITESLARGSFKITDKERTFQNEWKADIQYESDIEVLRTWALRIFDQNVFLSDALMNRMNPDHSVTDKPILR